MIKQAVILAAGLGSRLGTKTKHIPKAFLEVGNETLISRSIKELVNHGIEKIVIGTGYQHTYFDSLKSTYSQITTALNSEYSTTGSLATLCCLKDAISEDFLLLEGDLLYESRAISEILDTNSTTILCSGFTQSNDEVFIEAPTGQLINMSKNRHELNSIDAELVGISRITSSTYNKIYLNYLKDVKSQKKLNYEDALVQISTYEDIMIKKVDSLIWCEIDTEEHLLKAQQSILPRLSSNIRNSPH